jgi:hypothetical protein
MLFDGGPLQLIAYNQQAAPGTGGATYIFLTHARLGVDGAMAWRGTYTGPSGTPGGVFVGEEGAVSGLALTGQSAPGGGTFQTVVRLNDINASGDVLFHARVDLGGGSVVDGLFLARSGGILTVARVGDPAPGTGGATFDGVEATETESPGWAAALTETGTVAFRSRLAGGSHTQGVFLWTPEGGASPLVLPGDPVLTPRGGTFTGFASVISMNASNEVVLEADFERPGVFAPHGVFVVSPTAQREIVSRYDALPGVLGAFSGVAVGPPRINAAGDVAFTAGYEGSGGQPDLFVTRGHVLQLFDLWGKPVPGRPGVTFYNTVDDAVLGDDGRVLVSWFTTAGQGLFLATPLPPEVPLAPPLALGALAALLVLSGAVFARRSALFGAALCALLAPEAAPAQPAAYTIEKIAIDGESVPGVGTISLINYWSLDLDDSGRVAFSVHTAPGFSHRAILIHDGTLHGAVREGDPVPGFSGQSLEWLEYPQLGPGTAFVWSGGFGLPFPPQPFYGLGLFERQGGVDSALALEGQPAPGGGSFEHIQSIHEQNASGDVLFRSTIDTETGVSGGLFLARATGLESVVRDGDPAPASVGGTFTGMGNVLGAGLAADGTVAFGALVTGGSVSHGIFLRVPGGAITPLLLPGEPILTPSGGSFEALGRDVSMAPDGDVVLEADIMRPGGTHLETAVFAVGDEGQRELVHIGQTLPGTGGAAFNNISWLPSGNASGTVALVVSGFYDTPDPPYFVSALYVTRGTELVPVLKSRDPLPELPGQIVDEIHIARINASGQIAFTASTSPLGRLGVFLATPVAPEVPLAPPLALGALAAMLLATAHRVRGGRR